MKKILTIGMIFLMVLVMVGCGKSEPAEPVEPEVEVEASEVAEQKEVEAFSVDGHKFSVQSVVANGKEVEVNTKESVEFAEGKVTLRNDLGGEGEPMEFVGEYKQDGNNITITWADSGESQWLVEGEKIVSEIVEGDTTTVVTYELDE